MIVCRADFLCKNQHFVGYLPRHAVSYPDLKNNFVIGECELRCSLMQFGNIKKNTVEDKHQNEEQTDPTPMLLLHILRLTFRF